ncbi:MAG: 5'/3'-nucleotidase SurE [candidate division Zixibacteria bacterium]|nr:5'/3'-nucleotidase SurE [candidate division Zixibacteria bacterium]
MLILLTNDDGLYAEGIGALEKELKKTAQLLVVAPDREQSASSHSLTLTRPLRLDQRGSNRYSCDGTPTDCIMLAVHGILKHRLPDLLISGINEGGNMGEDVTYSGTVAAAIEGSILGIPAIAVSNMDVDHPDSFPAAAKFIRKFVRQSGKLKLPVGTFININFPILKDSLYKKYKYTCLGKRVYQDIIIEKIDPRGKNYYWIAGQSTWTDIEGSDFEAVSKGFVSISPLKLNYTDFDSIKRMGHIKLKF